ncbi:MAG: adenylyl cyclase, partial [Gammaproteobacteria bacterium]|nr:adenylyl cyclase [Gammaproteobacteria bacterium]
MSFLGEIKHRKIFQVAAVYVVVAWLIVQIIVAVEAPLHLPDWVDTLVIVLLAVGFPITLIVSWGFNLTPEGIVREGAEARDSGPGMKIEYVLLGVVVIALIWLVYRVEFDRPQQVTQVPAMSEQVIEEAGGESPTDVLPNSIAVLPFENLSPDPDNAYFAAGIHESTLNQLGKIRDLAVIARTSVMQYKQDPLPIPEIAKALNVETVMEGSVRYADGRVLITAQLIDGRTGRHLWSDEFNRELADLFAVQAEVAQRIATALQVQLLPEEQARIET